MRATDRGDIALRYVDYVRVKGRSKPERVYEVLDPGMGEVHRGKLASMQLFQQGINRFYSREFPEAQTVFERIARSNPGDRVARIFLSRCRALIASGVPDDWDGVAAAPK
jgi:hemerythrin